MSMFHLSDPLVFLSVITICLVLTNHCLCVNSQSFNESLSAFSPAVATWYGSDTGPGSVGGACGFGDDVAQSPYDSLVSAGNHAIYKAGAGCGACYQVRIGYGLRVKCTEHPSCSGYPITVTIADECPGCPTDSAHFDLSGKAFGYLAKTGQDYALRSAGKINIQYQRVPCFRSGGITLRMDAGATTYYLAFVIENVNRDGDIGSVWILPYGSSSWFPAQHSWGAVWEANVEGWRGPYTISITTAESGKTVTASNVIPANWVPGGYYHLGENIGN